MFATIVTVVAWIIYAAIVVYAIRILRQPGDQEGSSNL